MTEFPVAHQPRRWSIKFFVLVSSCGRLIPSSTRGLRITTDCVCVEETFLFIHHRLTEADSFPVWMAEDVQRYIPIVPQSLLQWMHCKSLTLYLRFFLPTSDGRLHIYCTVHIVVIQAPLKHNIPQWFLGVLSFFSTYFASIQPLQTRFIPKFCTIVPLRSLKHSHAGHHHHHHHHPSLFLLLLRLQLESQITQIVIQITNLISSLHFTSLSALSCTATTPNLCESIEFLVYSSPPAGSVHQANLCHSDGRLG